MGWFGNKTVVKRDISDAQQLIIQLRSSDLDNISKLRQLECSERLINSTRNNSKNNEIIRQAADIDARIIRYEIFILKVRIYKDRIEESYNNGKIAKSQYDEMMTRVKNMEFYIDKDDIASGIVMYYTYLVGI